MSSKFSRWGIAFGLAILLLMLAIYLMPFDLSGPRNDATEATYRGSTADMIVGGGCFWCVEADLEKVPGVVEVISGYSGGTTENPTYENYAQGGHREVARVVYDPSRVTYRQLLLYFLKHIDPTDGQGQFVDRGKQYAPAIYVESDEQRRVAEEALVQIKREGGFKTVAVPVLERRPFWPAEEYHQDYYKKNRVKYTFYRHRSGRDDFIETQWPDSKDIVPPAIEGELGSHETIRGNWRNFQKPSDEQLQRQLSEIQYKVTQQDDTEPAFANEYWDNKEEGIYVDIVSGEPLFSSINKYKSGTGWPSFTKPLESNNIVTRDDWSWLGKRIDVRSKRADSHLGHVFDDGPRSLEELKQEHSDLSEGDIPEEFTGKRYCLNSAAFEFIPKDALEARGYGEYAPLFK
jgi:peptide methionine sulfoxide reductase msrA/msrB